MNAGRVGKSKVLYGARRQAWIALRSMREQGLGSQRALDVALRQITSAMDRSLATELLYGVLRQRRSVDEWLGQRLDRGLRGLDPRTLDALRLGAYQLAFLERVPDHAAIAATIDELRDLVPARSVGLLNAVLRRIARDQPWSEERRSGLPPWIEARVRDYARALALSEEAMVWSMDERAPQHVHVVAPARAEAVGALAADGVMVASVGDLPGVYEVMSGNVFQSELFRQRQLLVQDAASAAVVAWAEVDADDEVLDLCAGRGAKSLFLAASGARVTLSDLSERRLQGARRLLQRAGYGPTACVATDASAPLPWPEESFDVVLCDAPCSGLGTLRRRPEVRHRRRAADLAINSALQAKLLANAARVVKVGGKLIYAVCSFVHEEGPLVVDRFLAEHPRWRRDPEAPGWIEPLLSADGDLRTHPLLHGADAFYAARLVRR